MPQRNAEEILEKIKNGTSTPEERAMVESWYLQWNAETAATEDIQPSGKIKIRKLYWLSAAASALLLLSAALYFYSGTGKTPAAVSRELVQDVKPGGNKATLTLSDGKTITLDDRLDPQHLSGSEKSIIVSRSKGELVYQLPASGSAGASDQLNTIATPRAGQYQVILSDGTHVWLNAASSIRFPVSFKKDSREVEITGEAYFEVAKLIRLKTVNGIAEQERIPFIVKTAQQKVEVLGTHFNINCYADEASTNTTLLEGLVRVSVLEGPGNGKPASYKLNPGQQARLTGQQIEISATDIEEAVAWKNGAISFSNADLQTIMRQVSRWYNVDVKYNGKIPLRTFTGSIPRSAKLSELLTILKLSNINFSINGSQLTVMP